MKRVYGTELLDTHFDRRMADVHTALVGKVEAYDAAAQTVDIKPQISRYVFDANGERSAEEVPTLYAVPVAFPRAGGFHISMPIAEGDYMIVLCTEEPTIAWRSKAEKGEPGLFDRHGLNGCFAIPCGYPDKEKLDPAPSTDAVVVSSDDGAASVTVKSGEVLLGDNTATDMVALASKVDDIIGKIDSMFRSWTPVSMDGGAALKTAFTTNFPSAPGSVAASKTKAK